MEYEIKFIPIKCTCGAELKEEGKDVTRKLNKFTDWQGVHKISIKGKTAICFDCVYCDSTSYQIIESNKE